MVPKEVQDRELPEIETSVGWKTTTVRLQQAQFDEANLFASALGLNMTDFTKEAIEHYITFLAEDERVIKSAEKQIARLQRQMKKIAARGKRARSNGLDDDE
jgi:hypothetical protein